jgi:hypothetical protein
MDEKFGMKGLRPYPKWHNYSLADQCLLDLIEEGGNSRLHNSN